MKFKGIFVIFNAVVAFSFLFVFLMPLFVLDGAAYGVFLASNWYLAIAFLAVMGALNAYFIVNWSVFRLLEREDWPALNEVLKDRLFGKNRYSSRDVALFVNTSLLMSDIASIERLERELREKRPRLLAVNAAQFGVARLLKGDHAESAAFFREFAGRKDVKDASWLSFDLAFSAASAKRYDEAVETLISAWDGFREPTQKALASYLLGSLRGSASGSLASQAEAISSRAKEELTRKYPKAKWGEVTEAAKGNVHVVILSKLVDDATAWLHDRPAERAV